MISNTIPIIKEKFKQIIEANNQYKSNLYSVIGFDIVLLFVFILFFQIYAGLVNEILNWTKYDFIVYYFTLYFGSKGKWLFSLQFFREHLLRGDLNIYLTKPMNIFIFENLKITNAATLITLPISFILFIVSAILGDYNYLNIFYGSILLIIGTFFEIILINFVESISFFIKDNRFLSDITFKLIYTNEKITPKIFSNLSNIFYLLSTSIYGYFVIEILNNKFKTFLYFLPYIIIFYLSLSIGIYFLWKIGLEKYEAFG